MGLVVTLRDAQLVERVEVFAGFELFADEEECDLGGGGEGNEGVFSSAHNGIILLYDANLMNPF